MTTAPEFRFEPGRLSNSERRLVAHLAIPRNVDDLRHSLHTDPFALNLSQDDAVKGLEAAISAGWVAKLDGDRPPGEIAASLPSGAREMPDEQARIYEARLSVPTRRWRASGDLFVVTEQGVEGLREPGPDEPPPMTPSQVQVMIDMEWARTIKDRTIEDLTPESDLQLHNAVLLDEFQGWANAVADDCESRWNVRPRLPVAGGAGWTDVVENRIIDWENQKTAMPALVAPWFMCLVILALTDTDTPTTARDGTHIPTYTGYAEKSVAAADMNAASGGSAANANAITFAACTAGSSTIVGFGNKETNGTTGDLRKYGTCASTTVSTTQTPATFNAGAYTTSAD